MGGIGFYPVFLIGMIWVLLRWPGLAEAPLAGVFNPKSPACLPVALIAGTMLMFFCGLLDDLRRFNPATKLIFQFVAASLVILAGGVFPLTVFRTVNILVTYFWFIGIMNAVNMLDNMDGLCAGVVLIATVTILTMAGMDIGVAGGAPPVIAIAVIFAAALAGFLVHNWPPAAIFMGDCGSMFVGFVLAMLAMPSSLNGHLGIGKFHDALRPVMALIIPAAVLAIPIFDTSLVTLTRLWRAQSPSEGGRDHSSHRLVGLGLSETKAVVVLYGLAALGGGLAILIQRAPELALVLAGFFVLILVMAGVYLGRVRVELPETGQPPPAWTPIVTNLLYKKQAASVVLDGVLAVLCFYAAYMLRFEGILPRGVSDAAIRSVPVVVACCLVANFLARIYQGQWRLITAGDLPSYALAAAGGSVVSLALVTLLTRFEVGHSRSAYGIFGFLYFLALVGSRMSFRTLDSIRHRQGRGSSEREGTPVLIYGAGRAGLFLLERMSSNPKLRGHFVAGFVDDDPGLSGRRLAGVSIRNGDEWALRKWEVAPEIWISSDKVPEELARRFAASLGGGVKVKRMKIEVV